ncbi:MAG TPA: ROK family transcriptional regulator [Firmicutes bacterium]|nr:ROK family transcriptional regulator [Bacillota bacterium]HHY98762.1 ROK family transcriptional regulator [Bacillota bacterium]
MSNSRDLKVLNRLLVRDIIRKHGPIPRYEVARKAGLTPPTVTVIVNDLLKAGVVEEVGHGESSGGRRPVLLELNPRAAFVFAVRIQRGEAMTALLDLAGNVLGRECLNLDTSLPDDVIEEVGSSFDSLLKNSVVKKNMVLWCGVATPGLIDSRLGVVTRSSNLSWQGVPFSEMLSRRLGGIPVHVENISNAAALAEKVYGSGQGRHNLVYLNLSVGVGAGVIIDDKVYGGARGYAGEIGHMILIPDGGPICSCGRHGCFEAICGVRAVLEQIRASVPKEELSRRGLEGAIATINDVTKPQIAAIPQVRETLERVGYFVGVAVANLMNLFNPEIVILGGELAKTGDLFSDTVERVAKECALQEIGEAVQIVKSSMKEDPPLMGAYALALEKVFEMDDWERPSTTIAEMPGAM